MTDSKNCSPSASAISCSDSGDVADTALQLTSWLRGLSWENVAGGDERRLKLFYAAVAESQHGPYGFVADEFIAAEVSALGGIFMTFVSLNRFDEFCELVGLNEQNAFVQFLIGAETGFLFLRKSALGNLELTVQTGEPGEPQPSSLYPTAWSNLGHASNSTMGQSMAAFSPNAKTAV